MKAKDWSYIAEGGAHAIFTYNPQQYEYASDIKPQQQHAQLHGKVLRIRKRQLTKTISQYHHQFCCGGYDDSDDNNYSDISDAKSEKRSLEEICRHSSFQYPFISHILRQYIDDPIPIELSFDFTHELYVKTLNDHYDQRITIPNSRLEDWFIHHENTSYKEEDSSATTCHICTTTPIKAFLQQNYRQINQINVATATNCNDEFTKQNGILSVEIKPKAGFIPYSPLIKPHNIVKLFHSRFEILQQLYGRNIITKGWSSSSSPMKTNLKQSVSHYNPLDLFSHKMKDIERAIQNLFECPQNNLKVYYNSIFLYGNKIKRSIDNSDIISKDTKVEVLDVMFSFQNDTSKDIDRTLQKMIQELASHILHHHRDSLLHNFLMLQQSFDYLDVDGALVIYQKLVELCNGSYDEADKLIDSDTSFIGKTVTEAKHLFTQYNNDDFHDLRLYFSSGSKIVEAYLKLCREFETYLATQRLAAVINIEQISDEIDSWHNRAVDIVQHFDKNDCVGSLQSWLMSLMMCDVSFILTLRKIRQSFNQHETVDIGSDDTDDKNGYTFYSDSSGHSMVLTKNGSLFEYQIKLIDIDGKPARKLRHKGKMEQEIKQFHSSIIKTK